MKFMWNVVFQRIYVQSLGYISRLVGDVARRQRINEVLYIFLFGHFCRHLLCHRERYTHYTMPVEQLSGTGDLCACVQVISSSLPVCMTLANVWLGWRTTICACYQSFYTCRLLDGDQVRLHQTKAVPDRSASPLLVNDSRKLWGLFNEYYTLF